MVQTRSEQSTGYTGKRMLKRKLPGKSRGRPQRRLMDAVKEDMQRILGIECDADMIKTADIWIFYS